MASPEESRVRFACFGGTCAVHVAGEGPLGPAAAAADAARLQLLAWHEQFSRFLPESELSRLNADPATTVPVSPLMARLARATVDAARASGGLVDATFSGELEAAGYDRHLECPGIDLETALRRAPSRRPAGADVRRRWAAIEVDLEAGLLTRPPGVRIDGGGLAKGLFADVLAQHLAAYDRFVVNCCGDLRVGGTGRAPRDVGIESPWEDAILHTFRCDTGAVATSSIGRRSWLHADGRPAHHLLDPMTGRPAYTGIVQATALAPTALEAERRSKTALLAGPEQAARHLPHGGLLVLDDRTTRLVAADATRVAMRFARRDGRLVPTR